MSMKERLKTYGVGVGIGCVLSGMLLYYAWWQRQQRQQASGQGAKQAGPGSGPAGAAGGPAAAGSAGSGNVPTGR